MRSAGALSLYGSLEVRKKANLLLMPVRIQSVSRALRILDTLTQHPEGLGVVDIAKQLSLNVSTTHHLVNTLVDDDYVTQLDSGVYRLGRAVMPLYDAYMVTQKP